MSAFAARKTTILRQLALPDADYSDASPKGSVDAGIRHLIDEINAAEGFVTTSSCAGRVSVFLEGRKATSAATPIPTSTTSIADVTATAALAASATTTSDDITRDAGQQVAGVGGKGAGGAWLYVSHEVDPLADEKHSEWLHSLGLSEAADPADILSPDPGRRLIHFKFEPMILHVLTASPAHAQLLLRCALQAGFRESGAVSIAPEHAAHAAATPVVAVRSMGLGLESLVGYQSSAHEAHESHQEREGQTAHEGERRRIVQPEYLRMLLRICNERFVENAKRIERFRSAFAEEGLRSAGQGTDRPRTKMSAEGGEWEDPQERRERKRAEGLRRKAELQAQQEASLREESQ